MKDEKIFFSGGQDLCVWNEKGELLDKMSRNSEHCELIVIWLLCLNIEVLEWKYLMK